MPTKKKDAPEGSGPWWVEDDKTGHKFATYRMAEGLSVLDESPFTRNGDLRAAEPRGAVDPAAAVNEGESL